MTPREFQLELFMRAVTAYAVKNGDNVSARQLAHDLSSESVKDCIRLGLFRPEDAQGFQALPLQAMPQQQQGQMQMQPPPPGMGMPGAPMPAPMTVPVGGAGLVGSHTVVPTPQAAQPNPMAPYPYPQQQPQQQPTAFAPQYAPQPAHPGTQPAQQVAVPAVQPIGAPGFPPVAPPVAAPAVHIPVVGAPTPQAAVVGQVNPSVTTQPTAQPAQAPQHFPPVVGQPTTQPQTQTQQPNAQPFPAPVYAPGHPMAPQPQPQPQFAPQQPAAQPAPQQSFAHPQAQPTPQPTGVGGAQTPIAVGEGQVAQAAQPIDVAGTLIVPPTGQTFQPPAPIGSQNTVQQQPIPQGNSALGGPGIVSEPVQMMNTPTQVVAPGNQAVQSAIGAAPQLVKEQVVR